MAKIEEIEMQKYQADIAEAMTTLFEKYRSIFEWDIPDADQVQIDKTIIAALRASLNALESKLAT